MHKTVVVAMSGGVDSSVVAYLLSKRPEYKVVGIFMKNWEEKNEEGQCCSAQDYADVERVADQIGIPYYTVSFAKEYKERVFERFLRGYSSGSTPNPDVLCNREVKFDLLQRKVRELGGDYLATGHYCQLDQERLFRGADSQKDQSYFLCKTPKCALHNVLFPLGKMGKNQVRAIAEEKGLATAYKKDSTGICFIGKRNFKEFLGGFMADLPGDIVEYDTQKVIGQHEGAHYYTMGQRRGLNIGGLDKPCFVVGKDVEKRIVYVVRGNEHPLLYRSDLTAMNMNWFVDSSELPSECTAKIRYRSPDEPCEISLQADGSVYVRFSQPVKAVTPGQTIAFYQGDLCLGGGDIDVPILPN